MEKAVSLPVFGFSEGLFSMCTRSTPNSPSTSMSWQLRCKPGTAIILTCVRSGPTPARLTAADTFKFAERYCVLPTSLTVAYALAIAASGLARRVYLAGFDGYSSDDPRNVEVDRLLIGYLAEREVPEVLAITPSRYSVAAGSVYSLI